MERTFFMFSNSQQNHQSSYAALHHLLWSGFGRELGGTQAWAGQLGSALETTELICLVYNLHLGATKRQFNIKRTDNQISHFTVSSGFLIRLGHKWWLWIVSLATVSYYFFLSSLLLEFCFTSAFLCINRNRPFLETDGRLTLSVWTVSWSTWIQLTSSGIGKEFSLVPHWHPWVFLCSSSELKGHLKLCVTTSIKQR